jgi:dTDP-4-amino-4,6-dideoxygalactose transaminase
MNNEKIYFNQPYTTGNELRYIKETFSNKHLAGDGVFTRRCHSWFEKYAPQSKALLTHSCTAALEMSALLLNVEPGDEIIMPSYTFVSTASAFVMQGGVPVFVDIREDTLNIDERLLEEAITEKTKAVVAVHYAGVSCEMDAISNIAYHHNLSVVEDAAQGLMATYNNIALGTLGDLGAYSFHETKNIISGEGGSILINDPELVQRGEIIREKGTNRSRFLRGEVDKYTWCELGSSYLPSEIMAAFLWAQLEQAERITAERQLIWNYYHQQLESLELSGLIRRPIIPKNCQHNAHMYYLILSEDIDRQHVLRELKKNEIHALSHYVPLHSSPAGLHYGKISGDLPLTDSLSVRIMRLPLWVGLSQTQQDRVVAELSKALLKSDIVSA